MAVTIKEVLTSIPTVDGEAVLFKCIKPDASEITLAVPIRAIVPMIESLAGVFAKVHVGRIVDEMRQVPALIAHRCETKASDVPDGVVLSLRIGARDGLLNFYMDRDTADELCTSLSDTLD